MGLVHEFNHNWDVRIPRVEIKRYVQYSEFRTVMTIVKARAIVRRCKNKNEHFNSELMQQAVNYVFTCYSRKLTNKAFDKFIPKDRIRSFVFSLPRDASVEDVAIQTRAYFENERYVKYASKLHARRQIPQQNQ